MIWTSTTSIDKTNPRFGIVATIVTNQKTIAIWQDTTNPPSLLDMDAIKTSIANLPIGFYTMPDLKIFAEIVANG